VSELSSLLIELFGMKVEVNLLLGLEFVVAFGEICIVIAVAGVNSASG